MSEHINQPNGFNGGMNLDDDTHVIDQNDYLYALNIRNGLGAIPGATINMNGNVKVSAANILPAIGSNKVIGTCEDKRSNTIFYFVYNSLGEHCILRYYPEKTGIDPNGEIELIIKGSALNFEEVWNVHSSKYVDDKFLYWVDSFSDKADIEGNPPRKINAVKANITNKQLEYELMAGLPNQNQFITSLVDNNFIVFELKDRVTNAVITTTSIPPTALNLFTNNPYLFLIYVMSVVPPIFVGEVEFEYCEECRIKIKVLNTSYYFDIYETVPPTPNINILFVRTNHYPATINSRHLDLIKWPPSFECYPAYTFQTDFAYNNVSQTLYQFRIRYWYDDGEKSAWGPISILALPLDTNGEYIDNLNAIGIDFTDTALNDPDMLCIIRKVEIAYREGNLGLFRSCDILDICEIGINQQIYYFRNDKTYSIVSSDDVVTAGQTQALKLFDSVPRISGTLEVMSDREGNNRMYLGANLENYNVPDCVELDFNLQDESASSCLVTITGRIDIRYYVGTPVAYQNNFFYGQFDSTNQPISNETVLEGFVVYLAGTTYYGISKNFAVAPVVTATGLFSIPNVPRGKYVLRVANYRCRFDNTKGSVYNLNSGIEWQKTSSPVIDCAGSLLATGIPYEREIDITAPSSSTFDLLTEPGYGPILIQSFGIYTAFIEGYFFDNNAISATNQDRRGAIACERQYIEGSLCTSYFNALSGSLTYYYYTFSYLAGLPLPVGSVYYNLETDHNGYFWFMVGQNANALLPPLQGQIQSGFNLWGGFKATVRDVCGAPATRTLDVGELKAYASIGDLYLGTDPDYSRMIYDPATTATSLNWIITNNFIIYNADVTFTQKNKTNINGSVFNVLGTNLANVLTVYTRNGRQTTTSLLGQYSITVYCPYDSDVRNDDTLYSGYTVDLCYDYPPDYPTQIPNISLFCTNPYDFVHPYTALTVTYPFSGLFVQNNRYFKRGGVYRVGVVYEDYANRKCTVAEADLLKIPYFTETSGGPFYKKFLEYSINNVPPIWATHYRIVISNDGFYRRYLQWVLKSVSYVVLNDINANPVFLPSTSFSSATHVMLELSEIITNNTGTNPISWFFVNTNQQGFVADAGDRVRIILNEVGALVSNTRIYDFEIVGTYSNNNQYYVVIENPQSFQEIKANFLVEFYTPQKNKEVVFYEIGTTNIIIDAGTATRRHAGSVQNQVVGTLPAVGIVVGGDTYWRNKSFPVQNNVFFSYQVENSNITDRFDSTFSDIGRPNIKDPDFGERFYFNNIRFSNIYIPNSKINGLSSFKSIDTQSLDLKYGILMKLIAADNVMLAICQFKTQPIYVGKDRVLDLSGAGSIGRSDSILNMADELKYDLGTVNPESVIEQDGNVYAIDIYQGNVWRYSANGQFPISQYKAQRFFNDLGHKLYNIDRKQVKIFGFYEREHNMYGMTVQANDVTEGFTIEFSEIKNRWNNFASFRGDYYCSVGDRLVSFYKGDLYVHEGIGNVPCIFYNISYPSQLEIVSNQGPRAVKNWWNISIQADNQWKCPYIYAPASYSYPFGMESELDVLHFSNEEGIWKADFLRDKTDPDPRFNVIVNPVEREIAKLLRGRMLRGEVLIVRLELVDSKILSILRRVDIESSLSMNTKG